MAVSRSCRDNLGLTADVNCGREFYRLGVFR